MRSRRKAEPADDLDAPVEPPTPSPRSHGPWDAAEKDAGDDSAYLDLGSLLIRGRPGFNLQMPADDDAGTIGSVVLVTEESGLELRAFADARSGGLWDDVRADLEAEADRLGGAFDRVEGPFGTELHLRVPVTRPDGEEGFQQSRIVGIEGPRWMLRATFLGREAVEPSEDGLLMTALRDVVVVRGAAPRAPREPLLLTVGDGLVALDDDAPAN